MIFNFTIQLTFQGDHTRVLINGKHFIFSWKRVSNFSIESFIQIFGKNCYNFTANIGIFTNKSFIKLFGKSRSVIIFISDVDFNIGYRGKAKYLIGVVLDPVLLAVFKFRFHEIFVVTKILLHSALKLEKSAISKVQKRIFYNFKNGKKSFFGTRKKLKTTKNAILNFFLVQKLIFCHFWNCKKCVWNCTFF